MNYLQQLTEEEINYICLSIPYKYVVGYFKTYPKEFAKIRPGFRPTSLNASDAVKILKKYHDRKFINSFLEKTIDKWLVEIEECLDQYMNEGESFELSCLHTLPESYFADNVALYFKLSQKEYSKDFVTLMSVAVSDIKDKCENSQQIDELEKKFEEERSKLNSVIDKQKKEIYQEIQKSRDKDREIKELSCNLMQTIESFDELQQSFDCYKNRIEKLEDDLASAHNRIKQTEKKLTKAIEEKDSLREALKIREEQEKRYLSRIDSELIQPKRPCDIDEFEDYFTYNITTMGIDRNSSISKLFIKYLEEVLFCGIPILIKHNAGINLARCVANTLYGQMNVEILKYSQNITDNDISKFLSESSRVVCLDGFIGSNYNELELFPLLNSSRDKIIFVTYSYDKNLKYVSEEILAKCNYLNLNRIQEFSTIQDFEEDPSFIEECDFKITFQEGDPQYKKICKEILQECGMKNSVVEYYCAQVNSEKDLCCMLAFVFLPYISDVMDKKPYNCSKRLQKYAGESGRCPEKEMLIGWFG